MTDRREIHITADGDMITLNGGSNENKFGMNDVLALLCRTIACIYLEAVEEGTSREEFADAIRDYILRILTTEAQENAHCDTK